MIQSQSLNIHNENNKTLYFSFPSFDKYKFVKHAFSSRIGGVSTGIYESMNLSFTVGDKIENVIENYRLFCNAVGIEYRDLVFSSQTHGNIIKVVDKNDRGKGIFKEKDYDEVDGLITNTPKLALVTHYADCVPLFFLDPVKKVVGLAHAGWKGTVYKIGEKMVDKFVEEYGCHVEDIIVGIGPSIGKCCYEVDWDVANRVQKLGSDFSQWINDKGSGKYILDLWGVNSAVLQNRGIKKHHITITDLCTKCHKASLFSHRGHCGKRGGLAAVIQIEN